MSDDIIEMSMRIQTQHELIIDPSDKNPQYRINFPVDFVEKYNRIRKEYTQMQRELERYYYRDC